MRFRTHAFMALVTIGPLLGTAAPVSAQSAGSAGVGQIMMGLTAGGGWVGIPIEGGKGSFSTVTVPTAAMSIAGCVNVWWGHSGSFEIRAHESVLGSNLRISAEPGVGVPFEHDFGMTAQVDIEFEWSEPRDTTLMLWVGLDPTLESPEAACEPDHG
jgi:hypothetical protein